MSSNLAHMPRDWDSVFRTWACAPSPTERTKCAHAETAVRNAIEAWPGFVFRNIKVFAQGSYANRTNIGGESDVDIAVCCADSHFFSFQFAQGFGDADVANPPATYTYGQFKNDVQAALRAHFGAHAVQRGNKAFDVHENSYRVDADVVPCFEFRRYTHRDLTTFYFDRGTAFLPDNGGWRVENWPRHNYDNGVAKNQATAERFKAFVRVLKRLREEMAMHGIAAAQGVPSFQLESLVYNAPNSLFGHTSYVDEVRELLLYILVGTATDAGCSQWVEVNERKFLFRGGPWPREKAHAFFLAAWVYLSF